MSAGRYPSLPLQLKETILFKYDLRKQRAEDLLHSSNGSAPIFAAGGAQQVPHEPFSNDLKKKKKAKILALRKENGGRRREVEAFCGMTKIHAKKKKT